MQMNLLFYFFEFQDYDVMRQKQMAFWYKYSNFFLKEIYLFEFDLKQIYFGLNNYKKEKNENIKWYFKDAKVFIKEKNVNEYYDLIIMDINNTNSIEGISPPPVFFEQEIIDKIYNMLKPNGIYIIDLLARSYQRYKNAFNVIDTKFPHILYVDNNEDLNKIHLCFKTKKTNIEYLQTYAGGLKLLKEPEVGDIGIIEASANQFIGRFVDGEKQKEVLDAYIS